MDRPGKYHISDPVLPWVYFAKDAEAYFDYLNSVITKKDNRMAELEWILNEISIAAGGSHSANMSECMGRIIKAMLMYEPKGYKQPTKLKERNDG